ncbi:MAG: hypothetical protein B6D34_06865 [Candidatus Brocadia sp. UTAMX1]|jgi:4-amino-4-deoxy-L-arabinose transferase-like glycosyltransferase|nr:MAG: hypothetical protein B6D34_06865 [Candidatus Brocadia sp. UTAMX1]
MEFTKSKGLFITLLIILFIGGIYIGIRLLLPNHGLTGYYLYFLDTEPKPENIPLQPQQISSSGIRPNLRKRVYEGYPKKTLIKETTEDAFLNFNWSSEAKKFYKSPFTIEWDGFLKIEESGDYTFILSSDDGSELFLNDSKVIDNGGQHGIVKKIKTISLESGFYRFHMRYFDVGGGAVLSLKWKMPNAYESVIPLSQFYHEPASCGMNLVDSTISRTLQIEPKSTINENRIVFRKNDPAVDFRNFGILRTYYVNYWDNQRFQPPVRVPAYNIIWRGFVWIPKDGMYTFHADTNGEMILFIDLKAVMKYRAGNDSKIRTHLEKGWKPIQINYVNTAKYARLNLCWQKPEDNKLAGIPSRYLMPSENKDVFGKARLWFAAGFLVASVSLGFLLFLVLKNKRKSCFQEYVTYIQQNWPVVALIFIVILGAVLRFNHYSVIPPHGDTMDVYQEAWNGYHILHGDGPQSWEGAYFVSAYKGGDKSSLQWFGDSFTIVKRYIAHPPLFSIFAGIPPMICGAKEYLDCRLTTINITPIFFSTLTVLLVFCVSYKIYRSYSISIIASLLYATVPIFVVTGRIAKGDGLLALVLISGVLCVLQYAESGKKVYVIYAGLLAGVSFWSKEMGICAIVIIPLLLGRKGFRKEAGLAAGIGFAIAISYFLYCYLINPEAFSKMMPLRDKHQSAVFDMVMKYLRDFRITINYAHFGIGYYWWFWFALVYSMGKREWTVPVTAFILLMTISALSTDIYPFGWFLIPIYPFMAIAGGLFIRDLISRPNTAKALLILLILLAVPLREILPSNLYKSQWLFRYYLAIGILPFLAFDFFKHRITAAIAKTACYLYLSFFLTINIYVVYHLPDLYDPLKR